MRAQAAPTTIDDFYTPNAAIFTVAAPGFLANDISVAGGLAAVSIDPAGLQGTVSAFADGRFVFTPNLGLATNTSFIYRATDNSGGISSATVTFDMVSTLPVAINDSYIVNAKTFSVPAAGFLANDTGGIGALQAVAITASPSGGTVSAFADGRFVYTPDSGRATDDSFSYRISDEVGRTSEATVTLDLTSTLPQASDDVYDVPADLLYDVAALGFLANDTGGIGSLQAVAIVDSPDFGTLSAFADGSFRYTPQLGFVGLDSFGYRMSDDLGRVSEATVLLRVGGATDPVPAPEPGTLALSLVGIAASIATSRRRRAA